jgi:hypothetical protein
MRRFLLTVLVTILVAPAAALAADRAAGDGSLVVSGASARLITVKGSGLIFGHIDQGTVTVVDYSAADSSAPQISGASGKVIGSMVVYAGADVRFLFPNGRYSLRFDGTGISISAVGKGWVSATGLGTAEDGTVTVNGGKPQELGQALIIASFSGAGKAGLVTATASLSKGH